MPRKTKGPTRVVRTCRHGEVHVCGQRYRAPADPERFEGLRLRFGLSWDINERPNGLYDYTPSESINLRERADWVYTRNQDTGEGEWFDPFTLAPDGKFRWLFWNRVDE